MSVKVLALDVVLNCRSLVCGNGLPLQHDELEPGSLRKLYMNI